MGEEEMLCKGGGVERGDVEGGEEFVTVVKVEDPKYVTVVNVGPQEEEVVVYRLPGERLGLGLKFEGGLHSREKIAGVTIQCCAEDGPARRAVASWGPLGPGDSVVAVDGVPVREMTRSDCVRALKESKVVVRLGVRRGPPPVPPRRGCTGRKRVGDESLGGAEGRPPPPRPAPRAPRPLPPRLIHFLPKDHSASLLPPSAPTQSSQPRPPSPVDEAPAENEETKKEEEEEEIVEDDIVFNNNSETLPTTLAIKDTDEIKSNDTEECKSHQFENQSKLNKTKPVSLLEISKTMDLTDNIGNLGKQENHSNRIWGNDEKSCRSVKDKIALFSKTSDCNIECSTKALIKSSKIDIPRENDNFELSYDEENGTVATSKIFDGNVKKGFHSCNNLLDISQSADSVKNLSNSSRTQSNIDLLSSNVNNIPITPYSQFSMEGVTSQNANPPHIGEISHKYSPKRSSLHTRSLSLIDVVSKSNCPPCKSIDDGRRSSLNSIIEQRKKNMSKLRGLVIPEKVSEVQTICPIKDLPEIKSKTPITTSFVRESDNVSKLNMKPNVQYTHKNYQIMPSPPWKTENENNEIPKYSPAFKRKSLSIYGSPSLVSSVSSSLSSSREELRSCFGDSSKNSVLNNQNPPRLQNHSLNSNQHEPKSLESITSPSVSDSSFEYVTNSDSPSLKLVAENLNKITLSQGISTDNSDDKKVADESDNDSAVSSSRSSITQGLSPPHSPILEPEKSDSSRDSIKLCNSSNHTNSSSLLEETNIDSSDECGLLQNDAHRVLKSQSVEAINRKNVLTSAKHRNGLAVKKIPENNCTFNTNFSLSESETKKNRNYEIEIKNALNLEIPKAEPEMLNKVSENDLINNEEAIMKPHAIVFDKPEELNNMINGSIENYKPSDALKIIEKTVSDEKWADSSILKVNSISHNNDHVNTNIDSFEKAIDQKYSNINVNISKEEVFGDRVCSDMNVNSLLNSYDGTDNNKLKNSGILTGSKNSCIPPSLKNGNENDFKKSKFNLLKSSSVNDIKRVFEKSEVTDIINQKNYANSNSCHPRVSSIDSPGDDNFVAASRYNSVSDLQKETQFGSITSLASSTSLISQQELSQLIEESNQALQEDGGAQEVLVVVLHRETVGGSVGITLAGGTDYESKEITVHKVLSGSPADRDGRIKKGDRILSINGKSMKGLTHRESLAILKAPRPEVVLVVSRYRYEFIEENGISCIRTVPSQRQPRIPEHTSPQLQRAFTVKWGPVVSVTLIKDGSGLGFSLEGGKDSPFGDQPLTIKKIFTGGCAEKSGQLLAGDELLTVNNADLSGLSRIEAWALMKKLPDGKVLLKIRHPST